MMVCIDASVFVASARSSEAGHGVSLRFFKEISAAGESIRCPALVLPECAGAVARRADDAGMGMDLVRFVEQLPDTRLIPLDLPLTRRAAQIAARHRLRGADAVYVATAEAQDATLVTWDAEMRERGAAIVDTMTPTGWLEAQQA